MSDTTTLGRPTKYKPEYCELLVQKMSKGFSQVAFAADIGVCADTIQEWSKVHPDFSSALKKGMAAAESYWQEIGMKGMFNERGSNFSQGAWAFWMKARFGWRDHASVDVNVSSIKFNYSAEESDGEEK